MKKMIILLSLLAVYANAQMPPFVSYTPSSSYSTPPPPPPTRSTNPLLDIIENSYYSAPTSNSFQYSAPQPQLTTVVGYVRSSPNSALKTVTFRIEDTSAGIIIKEYRSPDSGSWISTHSSCQRINHNHFNYKGYLSSLGEVYIYY